MRECYKHTLDLLDIITQRLLEFYQTFLARGYRGSDILVEFCRGLEAAAHKTADWFNSLLHSLMLNGAGFYGVVGYEDRMKHDKMLIRVNGLRRYGSFFRIEEGAVYQNRGAQILPQDRSAAEVMHAASIQCSRSQLALPV